jgi:quinol-cytochrome oxidoreductase complex cytochrome b subunit
MKVIKTVYFTVFLIFINIYTILADNTPADPGTDPPGPLEPPGGPIDSYLLVLIIAALVLGMVVIYRNKIKKASV